jgi:zinc protease
MRRISALIFVFVFLTGCKAEKPSLLVEKSPGGIEYLRVMIPSADDTVIRIAWPSDWAFRAEANQAVPFIGVDLILAGGAEGHPAGEVVETFADLRAEGSLWVNNNDHVMGVLTAPKENFSAAVKIANAHLRAPLLAQDWFERMRDQDAADMAEAAAKPFNKGLDALYWSALGDSSLRRMLAYETSDEIAAATRDEVVQWHRETFFRSPAKIVIVGDVTASEAGMAVDGILEGLPDGKVFEPQKAEVNTTPKRILLHLPDAQTTNLLFVAPISALSSHFHESEEFVLLNALGGDDTSVLFDAVRTKLRATYGFSAGTFQVSSDQRFLVLYGDVETAKVTEVERVVRDTYAAFRNAGPDGDLQRGKEPFLANVRENENDPSVRSMTVLLSEILGHERGSAFDMKPGFESVTADSLKARLQSSFPDADDFTVLAVSPDGEALLGACVVSKPAEAVGCR